MSGSAPITDTSGRRGRIGGLTSPIVEIGRRGVHFAEMIGAELDPSVSRIGKAARQGIITALGAGILATLQIPNPLGLTLIVNFAAAELVFDMKTAVLFIGGSAIIDALALPIAGATVDMPGLHLIVFFALAAVTSYAIYFDRRLGRLWVWAQLPLLTAYYMMVYEPDNYGRAILQMWAGCAVGVTLLILLNRYLWPQSPAAGLAQSISSAAHRASACLGLIGHAGIRNGHLVRPIASRLGHHVNLMEAAARHDYGIDGRYRRLAATIAGERLHQELNAIGNEICHHSSFKSVPDALAEAAQAAESAIDKWHAAIGTLEGPASRPIGDDLAASVARLDLALGRLAPDDPYRGRLHNVATILAGQATPPIELPAIDPRRRAPAPVVNRFLARFSIRHSIALAGAFLIGLFEHDPAMHAALWLLMIGGPPSHGATVRKFTLRIIGAALGGLMAIVAIIVLSPNFTSLPSYMTAIFIGAMIMAYVGQGGGLLAYMAIGATVFLIAVGGVTPRDNVVASLWTVWGIMIGMMVRAVVSMVWREQPPRTLVEQFEPIIRGFVTLVREPDGAPAPGLTPGEGTSAVVDGVGQMMAIVNDADMEGRTAGIDSSALLEVLESLLILTRLVLLSQANESTGRSIIHSRMEAWRNFLQHAAGEHTIPPAPLRTMVRAGRAAQQDELHAVGHAGTVGPTVDTPLMAAFIELENRFERVWLDRR